MEDKNTEMNKPELNDPSTAGSEAAGTEAAKDTGKVTKKALTARGAFLIGIGGLLVALLIVGAVAWYTRISVVNQISMDAAQFDFKANYSDKDFIISAKDYTNVYGTDKAAPGTAGVIPILVQAGDSNVDVNYILKFNTSKIDDRFKRRLRFFYIPKEYEDLAWDGTTYHPEYEREFDSEHPINGSLKGKDSTNTKPGDEHYEYVYWEWVYDLNPHRYYSQVDKKWYATDSEAYKEQFESEFSGENVIDNFDKFDTAVGRGEYDAKYKAKYGETESQYESKATKYYVYDESESAYKETAGVIKAYQQAMEIKVDITGAMATPTYKKDPSQNPQDPTTGTYGSTYIDIAKVIDQHNLIHASREPETETETEEPTATPSGP